MATLDKRSRGKWPLLVLAVVTSIVVIDVWSTDGGWRACRMRRLVGSARYCQCQPTPASETARWVPGKQNSIHVPDKLAESLRLRTAVAGAPPVEKIRGAAHMFIDPQSIYHLRASITGTISKIGTLEGRPLSSLDRVANGQLLAEIMPQDGSDPVRVLAPTKGVITEKNVTAGDLVQPELKLFDVVPFDRKGVIAEIYRDDISTLEQLEPDQRQWQIKLDAERKSPLWTGRFERFDYQLDRVTENGHVIGWVDDPSESLKINQPVSVEIDLPRADDLATIPASALFHIGEQHFIFVQDSSQRNQFTLRQIEPGREVPGVYLVRSRLTKEQQEANSLPLQPGERVVDSGCLELLDLLRSLQPR